MGLFTVVHLERPKLVTVGVRPLREGETPVMEAIAGRTMKLDQGGLKILPGRSYKLLQCRVFPNLGNSLRWLLNRTLSHQIVCKSLS